METVTVEDTRELEARISDLENKVDRVLEIMETLHKSATSFAESASKHPLLKGMLGGLSL